MRSTVNSIFENERGLEIRIESESFLAKYPEQDDKIRMIRCVFERPGSFHASTMTETEARYLHQALAYHLEEIDKDKGSE